MSLQAFIFGRLLASQLRQPKGIIGKLVGRGMARQNKESNDWTISLLNIQAEDHVLEVGFGPGVAIKSVSQMTSKGFVAGIDFSEAMVQQASKLNKSEIKSGRVELKIADVSSIPYDDDSFDKVFAVNVIYLWPDLPKVVKELKRAVKPGGILALYAASLKLVEKMGLRQSPLFTIHKINDITKALEKAGFTKVWVGKETSTKGSSSGEVNCVLGEK
jgi:SAM-dependent methyltransferase